MHIGQKLFLSVFNSSILNSLLHWTSVPITADT